MIMRTSNTTKACEVSVYGLLSVCITQTSAIVVAARVATNRILIAQLINKHQEQKEAFLKVIIIITTIIIIIIINIINII